MIPPYQALYCGQRSHASQEKSYRAGCGCSSVPEHLLSKYKVMALILSIVKAGQCHFNFKVQPGLHGKIVSNNKIEHKKNMGNCSPP